ncbi:hypothetical protein F5Y11DRAFT_167601 [Daldinia sp. FL1419]|nr:hypothetical protein F5Y11DRAFT_167601 [Daldinia sp. FL1419]
MDATRFPPVSSVATPCMSALQAKLVGQIDQGCRYDELYATIVEMGEELGNQDVVDARGIIKVLREDEGNQMSLLLHSIPRPVLRSIVMRMVAHEFWERDSENRNLWYDSEGPGAYVATLSIIGRNGCSWSINENNQIISLLQTYGEAIDVFSRYGSDDSDYSFDDMSAQERQCLQTAYDIDMAYRKRGWLSNGTPGVPGAPGAFGMPSDSGGGGSTSQDSNVESSAVDVPDWWAQPRFSGSGKANKSQSVNHMISMLRKRNIAGVDRNEPCRQSVCMVGNSDDIMCRTQNHRLISSLSNSAKTWGLLVSCLKYAGIEAEDTILPACKAWKVKHINMAEILLTVLSGSLISVGGLNVKSPGTKSEKSPPSYRVFEASRTHEWKAKPWYEENMFHTIPHLRRLSDARQELEAVDHASLEESAAKAARLKRDLDEGFDELRKIERNQENVREELAEAQEVLKFAEEHADFFSGSLACKKWL